MVRTKEKNTKKPRKKLPPPILIPWVSEDEAREAIERGDEETVTRYMAQSLDPAIRAVAADKRKDGRGAKADPDRIAFDTGLRITRAVEILLNNPQIKKMDLIDRIAKLERPGLSLRRGPKVKNPKESIRKSLERTLFNMHPGHRAFLDSIIRARLKLANN